MKTGTPSATGSDPADAQRMDERGRQRRALSLGAALLPLAVLGARAQAAGNWPTKPITLLIPYAPGGTTDIMGRLLGEKLGTLLGQPIVAENRGGAGGTIAGAMLSLSEPDGYTIMLEHIGFAFNATLYEHLSFDPARDITPVAYVGNTPNVLVVSNKLPVHNTQEFLAYARAHPGSINYGSGGVGSAGHLPMAWLASKENLQLTHIPYKGSGPALTIPAVLPYIHAKQVRAIATSGAERAASLPDLPTMQEAGVKDFDYAPWYGVFIRSGTPPEIVAGMHDAINKAVSDPGTKKKMLEQGLAVEPWTQERFQKQVKEDTVRWREVIHSLNIHKT